MLGAIDLIFAIASFVAWIYKWLGYGVACRKAGVVPYRSSHVSNSAWAVDVTFGIELTLLGFDMIRLG